jgi:hypothetical protein
VLVWLCKQKSIIEQPFLYKSKTARHIRMYIWDISLFTFFKIFMVLLYRILLHIRIQIIHSNMTSWLKIGPGLSQKWENIICVNFTPSDSQIKLPILKSPTNLPLP